MADIDLWATPVASTTVACVEDVAARKQAENLRGIHANGECGSKEESERPALSTSARKACCMSRCLNSQGIHEFPK